MKVKNLLWDYYAKFYDSTVLNFSAYNELLLEIKNHFIKFNPQNILNVGCGTGNLEKELSSLNYQYKWIGIDRSTKMLEIAKNKVGDDSRFQFLEKDMNALSDFVSDKSFDCVIMINSLYAASNPDEILKFVNSSLSKGGKLIISNPKESSSITKMLAYEKEKRGLLSLIMIIIKLFPSLIINVLIRLRAGRGNFYFFSGADLKVKLENLGLSVTVLEDVYANQSILIIAQK